MYGHTTFLTYPLLLFRFAWNSFLIYLVLHHCSNCNGGGGFWKMLALCLLMFLLDTIVTEGILAAQKQKGDVWLMILVLLRCLSGNFCQKEKGILEIAESIATRCWDILKAPGVLGIRWKHGLFRLFRLLGLLRAHIPHFVKLWIYKSAQDMLRDKKHRKSMLVEYRHERMVSRPTSHPARRVLPQLWDKHPRTSSTIC